MALESGLLYSIRPKSYTLLNIQHAISYQLNLPLQIIRVTFDDHLRSCAVKSGLDLDALPKDIDGRTAAFYKAPNEWKAVFGQAVDAAIPVPASYSAPFSRIMRDYWAWSWSELVEIAFACRKMSALSEGVMFRSNPGFPSLLSSMLRRLDDEYLLLIGPCLLLDAAVTAQSADEQIGISIRRFNEYVTSLWPAKRQNQHSGNVCRNQLSGFGFETPIHSIAQILRYMYVRARTTASDIRGRAQEAADLYNLMVCSTGFTSEQWRPDAYSHVIGAAKSMMEIVGISGRGRYVKTVYDVPSYNDRGPSRTSVTITFDDGRYSLCREPLPAEDDQNFDHVLRRNLDVAFTNWNAFRLESLSILRDSLTTIINTDSLDVDENHEGFDRIVRFLTRSFDSDEGFLYLVRYGDARTGLDLLASSTPLKADPEAVNRLAEHMKAIGRGRLEDRRKSISYRAADGQIARVSQSYISNSEIVYPREEILSLPPGVALDARVSVIAVPIIVNGRSVGVLELVSKREYNFPIEAQKRVEESCALIASFIRSRNILRELDKINKTVVSDAPVATKMQEICNSIPTLFMCDCVGLFFRSPKPEVNGFIPFAERQRSDLRSLISDVKHDHLKGHECDALISSSSESSHEISHHIIGAPPFGDDFLDQDNETARFFLERGDWRLTVIPLTEIGTGNDEITIFGYLTLLFDERPASRRSTPMSEVASGYAFLRGLLTVALQAVYSAFVWERFTRHHLGHEITRVAIEMDARVKRLENGIGAISDPNLKAQLLRGVRDVKASRQDIGRLAEIVLATSVSDREDPLIREARRELALADTNRVIAISLRELANELFFSRIDSRSHEDSNNIRSVKFKNNIVDPDDRVAIPRSIIRDILGNLVENAAKHSIDKSDVEIFVDRGARHVIDGLPLPIADGSDDAYITITNFGPPMPEQERRRVFESGFRGDYAIRSGIPGTGRGLTYVQALVGLLNGSISYQLVDRRRRIDGQPAVLHVVIVRIPSERIRWHSSLPVGPGGTSVRPS